MSEDWKREEVEAAITDYFDMLAKELRSEPFNKAEHNRRLQKIVPARSRGSIEKKHQNISAVLLELGYPYINGYKPLRNYQAMLGGIVEERLLQAEALNRTVSDTVEREARDQPAVGDILSILVPAPSREDDRLKLYDIKHFTPRLIQRNYLEIEARNRSLGLAGEEFVMRFEHERLWRAGERVLADRIEHVSATKGDGLGYDVVSYETSGKERLIEVKTTRFGPQTPFFASRNEVAVSEANASSYQLYRLFNFQATPKLYTLAGSLRSTCMLEPVNYSAQPV
jgi:Domain of unknown function (DUF3883)